MMTTTSSAPLLPSVPWTVARWRASNAYVRGSRSGDDLERRTGASNLLIYKPSIEYLYKESEAAPRK